MNRKQFLHTCLPLGLAAFPGVSVFSGNDPAVKTMYKQTPPYLKPGDTIAITCPGSYLSLQDVNACVMALHSWQFKPVVGRTVGNQWERFGGTDDERTAELQQFLDDDNISAILFGRGGYGVMRIMDKLNWEKFAAKPKWLIGFSDITAIHCHVHAAFGIPTIHADMANGFDGTLDDAAISLFNALSGRAAGYNFAGSNLNREGTVTAELVGGNLSLVYAMQGSDSDLKTKGKILMLEDVSEYKYTIDRMLMNLKRSGKLDGLAALAMGSFTSNKTDEENFSLSIEDLVMEKVKDYDYPVCFGFPAGHQKNNLAFKLGLPYRLEVSKSACLITEAGNAPVQQQPNIAADSTFR